MTTEKKSIEDYLINKKIVIKPIIREGGWLPKGHDGQFMFTSTTWSTSLPIGGTSSPHRGQFIPVLTKDEQEAFEAELNLEKGALSFYNRKSTFWSKFKVSVEKEGRVLDLNNANDYLAWKVLQVDKRVANSWAERNASGEYKFALVDENEEKVAEATKTDNNLEAYKILMKIADNKERMQDLIKVITGNKTKSDKVDFLRAEVEKLIAKDAKGFVSTYNDPTLNTKILIERALNVGALERTTSKGYKLRGTEDADQIGENLTDTIIFLNTKSNSDVLTRLKSQIDSK